MALPPPNVAFAQRTNAAAIARSDARGGSGGPPSARMSLSSNDTVTNSR